jgi:hypothetical protein
MQRYAFLCRALIRLMTAQTNPNDADAVTANEEIAASWEHIA